MPVGVKYAYRRIDGVVWLGLMVDGVWMPLNKTNRH